MSDTFDVNSPEAQLMRLHEALDDLGRRIQDTLVDATAMMPEDGPVDAPLVNLVCKIARQAGEVQGMASILDTLGYGADR